MQLATGCAALVHAAGAVRGNCRQDFDRVNVAGTARLLDALSALEAPPRLLLLSSLAAREPHLSWYAGSKRAAEKLLQQRAGLDWIILRPPPVYGPGDREMLPIFESMHRGIAVVPGSAEARTSLVFVTDLVEAILACLAADGALGMTLTADEGRQGGYSWRDMAAIAGRHWSRRVRIWRVPAPLLDAIAAVNLRLARLTGRAAMLTPAKLGELRHPDWVTDNAAITEASGWRPRVGLAEGLQRLENAAL